MRIGVDFDNTIVCFDGLFQRAAREKKLIPDDVGASKDEVRNYLRKIGKEDAWTELQGFVYGSLIREAPAYPGVREFFLECRRKSIPVFIISHKTLNPFLGSPYNLHEAAKAWLDRNEFTSSDVFFELTKQKKIDRIKEQRCSHFIDDLPEFLTEPSFPNGVERILFDPRNRRPPSDSFRCVSSWPELQSWLKKS